MSRFRIVPQTAQTAGKVDMDVISRELGDLQWETQKIRTALSFRVRNREQIDENLRRIEKALTAQQEYAGALMGCLQDAAERYKTAETQVLAEYGVVKEPSVLESLWEKFRDQPDWLKMLELSYLPTVLSALGPAVSTIVVPTAMAGWGTLVRIGTLADPDAMPERYSLLDGELIELSGNFFGTPISLRADLDALGYERSPGDGYTFEEVKSYLLKGSFELDVGEDWHRAGSIGLGNTDSYLDCSIDDVGLGLAGLLMQTGGLMGMGTIPGEGMLQGSVLNVHYEEWNGTEEKNRHFTRDFYIGEGHAQFGAGMDPYGENFTVGADCDYGVSAFKFVATEGWTGELGTFDAIGGFDLGTWGQAYKAIITDHRAEAGFGFGGGEAGGYFGLKYYGY